MPPRFTPTESMLSGPNALVSMKGSSRTTPGEALQPGDSDLTHDARVVLGGGNRLLFAA